MHIANSPRCQAGMCRKRRLCSGLWWYLFRSSQLFEVTFDGDLDMPRGGSTSRIRLPHTEKARRALEAISIEAGKTKSRSKR